MKIWIRHLDGTVEDLGKATEAEALERFQGHDWNAELEDYDPEKDSADHCLPAFGIVDGEDGSCDLTPFDRDHCKVNLYFHKPGRLFGIFAIKKNVWEHLPRYPRSGAAKVIGLFFSRDIEGLLDFIRAEKARKGGG